MELRERAVLYEADVRDRTSRLSRKHQPLVLTPDEAVNYPMLAAHLATHDGWPPSITRSSEAALADLDAMHELRGSLALLTLSLDSLDSLRLKTPELAQLARDIVAEYVSELLRCDAPYRIAVQRGATGHTHAHMVVVLADMRSEHREILEANQQAYLLGGQAEARVIGNSPTDRARVATYVSRDADARLGDPTNREAYLTALEEKLVSHHLRSPRLSWSVGTSVIKSLTLRTPQVCWHREIYRLTGQLSDIKRFERWVKAQSASMRRQSRQKLARGERSVAINSPSYTSFSDG